MNSTIGKLNFNDLAKSAITATAAAVFLALYNLVIGDGFDVFTVDWLATGKLILNVAVSALVGDIGRRIFTDSEGKFLGTIG